MRRETYHGSNLVKSSIRTLVLWYALNTTRLDAELGSETLSSRKEAVADQESLSCNSPIVVDLIAAIAGSLLLLVHNIDLVGLACRIEVGHYVCVSSLLLRGSISLVDNLCLNAGNEASPIDLTRLTRIRDGGIQQVYMPGRATWSVVWQTSRLVKTRKALLDED